MSYSYDEMRNRVKPYYDHIKSHGNLGLVYANLETGDIFAVVGTHTQGDIPEGYIYISDPYPYGADNYYC